MHGVGPRLGPTRELFQRWIRSVRWCRINDVIRLRTFVSDLESVICGHGVEASSQPNVGPNVSNERLATNQEVACVHVPVPLSRELAGNGGVMIGGTPWHSWHRKQRRVCNLQILKGSIRFDSYKPACPLLGRLDEVVAEIVQYGEPISSFGPSSQQVERLNVGGIKSSAIERAVRYQHFHESRLLVGIHRNIQRIGACASSRICRPVGYFAVTDFTSLTSGVVDRRNTSRVSGL